MREQQEFIYIDDITEFPVDVVRQAGIRQKRSTDLRRYGAVDWYLVWPNGKLRIGWYQLNRVLRAKGHEQNSDAPDFQAPARSTKAN